MKCLVIGASGQVGGCLTAATEAHGYVCVGTAFRNPRAGQRILDLRDRHAVAALVGEVAPDLIFLPAALTHVDYGETHPEECRAINIGGTAHVARAARDKGSFLIFFSTEHVFGDSAAGHPEDAPPAPLSVYAWTKAAAEEAVRAALPDAHLILRTSWVFGPDEQRKNFVYRAVATLRRGESLTVPADQHGQPTFAPDLAGAALDLWEQGCRGTFHVVGPQHVNRLEFARLIARAFSLDARLIRGVATASLGQPAPRPLDPKLQRDKLCTTLGRDPIRGLPQALNTLRTGPLAA